MPVKSDRRRSIPSAAQEQAEEIALASAPVQQVELVFDYSQVAEPVREQVEEGALFIKQRMQRVRNDLIAVGDRLQMVKGLLPHGQFSDWMLTEFHLSQRMAQNMMNVTERFGAKNETVSLFSDSALYLLAAPSTPEGAIEAAARLAQQRGRSPSRSELKAIIDAHKEHTPEPEPDEVPGPVRTNGAGTLPPAAGGDVDDEPARSVQGAVVSMEQLDALRTWLGQWEQQADIFVAVTGKSAVKLALERLVVVMLEDVEEVEKAFSEL